VTQGAFEPKTVSAVLIKTYCLIYQQQSSTRQRRKVTNEQHHE